MDEVEREQSHEDQVGSMILTSYCAPRAPLGLIINNGTSSHGYWYEGHHRQSTPQTTESEGKGGKPRTSAFFIYPNLKLDGYKRI